MKFTTLFLAIGFILACSKESNSGTPVTAPIIYSDPVQYGVPFSSVPDARDVVIYQVNMRAFSSSRNFQGVIDRLDQIKALGVNVIYLMPIYPVGILNGVNSPYCIKNDTVIGSEFGTITNLRALIDQAHSKNMTVILDWVANHTSWDHVWINNKSWYQQDVSGNIISPPNTGWTDVAQLNYSNADMRIAMIRAMKYWVYKANVDGFRCDAADYVPVDFWKQAIDTLRNIKTHKLLMLAEGSRTTNFAAGFDFNFGFAYYDALKAVSKSSQSVVSLENLNNSEYSGALANSRVVRYITNHDVNSSDDIPQNLFGGNSGALASFITAAYMKSVPMIYNGQEVANATKIVFPFTSGNIDWTQNADITAKYTAIIALRNQSNAIRRGTLTPYSSSDVCAFAKELDTEKVVVFSNLRNKAITYTVPTALVGTVWKEAFSGTAITLGSEVQLSAYAYLVLKNN